jgi:DNA end-binding protein Ku
VPRALWSGSITFGLVNVPVRVYSAIAEHKLHFHLVHKRDDSPIGYQKVCKKEGKPVPDREIVKGFEFGKGEYVYLEPEDFEAVRAEGYKTIDITDFVPADEIDPIYFSHTYYVGPQEGSERVYALLVQAMERAALTGIAKFVMRDQQHVGALRIREGVITLEQLHFADEIRPVDEIRPGNVKVDKRELQMAEQLIDSFRSEWQPERYKDTYRDALYKIIRAKRAGKEVHVREPEEEEAPTDLLAALRASVQAAQRSKSGRGGRARPRDDALDSLSKSELEQRAKRANIPGRSKMSKDELIEALTEAA